jgi:hypothetical protein
MRVIFRRALTIKPGSSRMADRRVIVVRPDGAVFGYDIVPDDNGATIQAPFVFGGSKVATDGDDDRFVAGMFTQIIVIHRDGSVSGPRYRPAQ